MGPRSLVLLLLLVGKLAHASGYQGGGGTGGGGGDPSSTNEINTFTADTGGPTSGLVVDMDGGTAIATSITGDIITINYDGTLSSNSDVLITSPATGAVLKFNGTHWIDDTDATGGGGANSFETIAVPLGSGPLVADSATDTLTLTSSGIVTITGTGLTDTIMFSATEVGDVSSVYDCTTGACTAMTIGSGQSLGVSGTGTNVATSGTTATGFFSTGTISPLRLPDADDDSTTKGIVTFLNEEFDCAAGVCLLSGGAIDGGVSGEIQDGTITADDLAAGSITAADAAADMATEAELTAGLATKQNTPLVAADIPAATADCAANKWTKGIDAGHVLDCTQPAFTDISGTATDAQIPDTLTLTDITQIGTRPHASLTSLTVDDHPQYALLAGRTGAGGQILYGGTASGEVLVLESTSNATKGNIYFGLGTEWEWADGIVDPVDASTAFGGKWDPTISVTGTSGTTSTIRGLSISPTVNYDDASGVIINTYSGVDGGGTFTVSGAGNQASSWTLFNATALLTASTAAKVPPTPIVFRSGITIDYSATSGTGTMSGQQKIFDDNTIYKNTDAGGTFTVAAPSSFVSTTQYSEAAGALNITTGRGFYFQNPTVTGTPQVTTSVGVDVDRPTRAATPAGNIGIRNSGSEVWAPNTQALADEFTINPVSGIIGITATTDPIDDGATSITDGTDGQVMIIVNVDETSSQTITFTTGANLALSVSPTDLDKCDSITVMFLSTFGIWVEIGRANLVC